MKRRYVVVPLVIMGGVATAACIRFARRQDLRWGATEQEVAGALPGDDLIAHSDLTATRAITIRASADQVWPWIAQLGQGRAGFYAYDVLENLVGCDIHSADHIVPEWQRVDVGDTFKLHPEVPLTVAAVEPARALVIHDGVQMGNIPPPYNFTWSFVLREQPDGTTRLLVREHYGYTRWWAPLLIEPVEVISFVMSQKMLRGIRDRAERSAARDTAGKVPSPILQGQSIGGRAR